MADSDSNTQNIQAELLEDFDVLRGDFNSLEVLMEQFCKTDMKIIASNPERIWKHEPGKKNDFKTGWKPDTTQLSSGALFQISEVVNITGVSGKGWNETSEYIMGKVAENKWIRLINFRGYATAVPDTDTFKKRTQKLVGKIQNIQNQCIREKEKRDMAEKRLAEAEDRVASTEEQRSVAEKRVKEFEENFRKMEALNEEKNEVAAKSVSIAQREAAEAKVLMRYFEDRMTDSEKNAQNFAENLKKSESTVRIKEAEVKELEDRIKDLEAQLEQSERIRMKLEIEVNKAEDSSTSHGRKESSTNLTKSKKSKPKRKNTNPVE